MSEALARLRLARSEGVGPTNHRRLLERFGSARATIAALSRNPERFRPAPEADCAREMAATAEIGGRFLFLGEPDYPPLMALLPDAPPVLIALGDPAALAPRAVAIVGARNSSAAGRRVAEDISDELAGKGIAVISGLARGIDAAAHQGALNAKGRTIAAIAGGIDVAYPPENALLQARIADQGGLLVTEAPLGTSPQARHFPRRNRIIAGLALGVVVVEAMEKSGTLITARLALEYGRELYAVPGSPADPRSRGSNDLLRQGAHLCENAADVLEFLPQAPADAPLFRPRAEAPPNLAETAKQPENASPDLAQVLELLSPTPISVDELARRCQLSAQSLRAILLDLELEGRVQTLPGNRVALL